jgi:hypothetical protein
MDWQYTRSIFAVAVDQMVNVFMSRTLKTMSADVASFVSIIKDKEKALPVFMHGHSAAVLLHVIIRLTTSKSLQVLFVKASPTRFLHLILHWQY